MPGTLAGTWRRTHLNVASATSSTLARSEHAAGHDHVRLQQQAAEVDALVVQLREHALSIRPVARAAASSECVPLISISGSTIGTTPASWHSAA